MNVSPRIALVVAVAVAAALWASPVHTQTVAPLNVADSARVARTEWAAAVNAFRAHDLSRAREAVERASASWPTQQAYVWNRALLAAALNDTTAARRALEDYANLGLGRDLADTTFDRFRGMAWF